MEFKLCEKMYGEEEEKALNDVIKSDKWTMGSYVEKFEKEFAKRFNFNYALMVNSGSSANLLALTALCNYKRKYRLNPGDEILVPAVCWSTSVYPIIQNNLKPVFIDSNPITLNIDADDIEKHPNAKGIVFVHVLGNSTNMNRAMEIVNKRNLLVLEDTCESLTSKFENTYLGGFGDMGTFSFYYSHHMTTIEGGMIVCKTKEDYDILKCIRSHGWTRYSEDVVENKYDNVSKKFCFVDIGYNLRPMEFQGSMGLVQLKNLDKRNIIRIENYKKITNRIKNYKKNNNYIIIPEGTEGCDVQWFCIPLLLSNEFNHNILKEFVNYLDLHKIENRPIITGNFIRQPVMQLIDKNINPLNYPGAEKIHNNGLYIGCPTNEILSNEKVEWLVETIFNFDKFNSKLLFFKKPLNIEKSIDYVNDAIKTTWISLDGKYLDKCKEMLKPLVGCEYVILTLTGSAAIRCMIKCLKYKFPECKKIYVPNNTFMACINVLLHEFPMECIELLDIDYDTLNIENVDKLEKNAALFVVHNVGGITNIPKIKRERPDLKIFEDNSEGYLGKYEGLPTGSQGIASAMSFNMNKNFTSGAGGAFCTNDKELYNYIFSYSRQGFTDKKFYHQMVGDNLRMTNVTAAILLSQIEQMEEILNEKKIIYDNYLKYIDLTNSKLQIQKINENMISSFWNFAFKINTNKIYNYEKIENELNKYNIDTRPMFLPIQEFQHLTNIKYADNTNSININNTYFYLPFNNVNDNSIKYIVNSINEIEKIL
tara:strand:- start:746 stop:3037 length:2292 start_codon:yes stop_codon:yes gene_type:complete